MSYYLNVQIKIFFLNYFVIHLAIILRKIYRVFWEREVVLFSSTLCCNVTQWLLIFSDILYKYNNTETKIILNFQNLKEL